MVLSCYRPVTDDSAGSNLAIQHPSSAYVSDPSGSHCHSWQCQCNALIVLFQTGMVTATGMQAAAGEQGA